MARGDKPHICQRQANVGHPRGRQLWATCGLEIGRGDLRLSEVAV